MSTNEKNNEQSVSAKFSIKEFFTKKSLIFAGILSVISIVFAFIEGIPFIGFLFSLCFYLFFFLFGYIISYSQGYFSNKSKVIDAVKANLVVGIVPGLVYGFVSALIPKSYVFMGMTYWYNTFFLFSIFSGIFWCTLAIMAGTIVSVYLDKSMYPTQLIGIIEKISKILQNLVK
ncbi:MAG: hypothetical protein NZZ41_03380 [Candidatus Dojkabacteria bacterium]|nr:hypothetical protein [Candidatus Dojkabacteria bacterium]